MVPSADYADYAKHCLKNERTLVISFVVKGILTDSQSVKMLFFRVEN